MIAAGIEACLQDLKMDRRHLWTEDGVVFSHLFGKWYPFDGRRLNHTFFFLFLSGADSSQQRTYTDTCGTEIVDLVDLQAGVDLSAVGKNLLYLIGGYGIQTAAEGVQLDQIQIVTFFDKVCRSIKSGMIHPLVIDTKRTFQRCQMRHRILSQYSDSVGINHIRDTMMDLRIYMVGTTGKNDTASSGFFHITKGFFSLSADIVSHMLQLHPCRMSSFQNFFFWKIRKFLYQALGGCLFVCQSQERIAEGDGRII